MKFTCCVHVSQYFFPHLLRRQAPVDTGDHFCLGSALLDLMSLVTPEAL